MAADPSRVASSAQNCLRLADHVTSPWLFFALETLTSWCLREELNKFSVDLLGARPGDAVGPSLDLHVLDVLDHLGLSPGRCIRRQDAIVIAVYYHGRQVVAGDVFTEVLDPRIDAGQGADRRRSDCDRPVGFNDALADPLSVSPANTVEVLQKLHERDRPVRLDAGAGAVEHFRIDAVRIVGRLDPARTGPVNTHRLAEPLWAVFADVSCDLAGAHGVSDQRHIGQIQGAQQSIEIGRERIVVVPDGWLARSAEAAAIIRDHAMASGQERGGLLFPGVTVQRPTMDQHDRRTRAVILVIDLDGRGVFLSDLDDTHGATLLPGLGQ